MKETDASLLSILNDLFAPLPKRRARELGLTEVQEAKYTARLSRELESSGSLDKVVIGTSLPSPCYDRLLTCVQGALNIILIFEFMMRRFSGTNPLSNGCLRSTQCLEQCVRSENMH